MIKKLFLFVFFVLTVCITSAPRTVSATTCNPGCPSGYTCGIDPSTQATSCLGNCADGSVPITTGKSENMCPQDEIVVTAAKPGKTFADVVDKSIVPLFDHFVIPLLYAILFLLFMFGMVRYFFFGGEENREKGKSFVVWGLIGMVAVFSVWGVVNLLLSVLTV